MSFLNEIEVEVPIGSVKSIDELYCSLIGTECDDPYGLAARIKDRIAQNVGSYITCSIGFAQNPLLAKMACKMDKPDGVTIWGPDKRHEALAELPLDDIPGVGSRMLKPLHKARIHTMADLLAIRPKHMRSLWKNVNGERL